MQRYIIALSIFFSLALPQYIYSDTSKNAEIFGSLPDIYEVRISPNGRYIAVQQKTEETVIVKILDLDSSQLVNVHDFGKKGRISDFFWATDNRIVFSVTRPDSRSTAEFNIGQLVAADLDGKNTKLIAGYGSAPDHLQGVRNRAKSNPERPASIVHRLPDDDDHILVNFFDNAGFNDLAKLNIVTGKVTFITRSPVIYPTWVFNNKGDLMGVWTSNLENTSEIYLYKPNLPSGSLSSRECGSENNCYIPPIRKDNKMPGWVFYKDFEFPKNASIEGFNSNGKMMVTEYMDQDTTGLYEYDLKKNTYELIYRHPRVDITGVASSIDDGPYGIRIDDGKPEYLYLSEPNRLKDLHIKFFNAFPGSKTMLTSRSTDYSRAVGYVSADNNPGIYYLLDVDKNQIAPLGRFGLKPLTIFFQKWKFMTLKISMEI